MPVMIQLRNVPDDIHRKLKARAAESGMSLGDYILRDVKRMAEQPTMKQRGMEQPGMEEWFEKLRNMKPIKTKETPEETIRAIRGGR